MNPVETPPERSRGVRFWKLAIAVSMALYAFSLFLPGFETVSRSLGSSMADNIGLNCLLFGGVTAFLDPFACAAWAANIFYFALLLILQIPVGRKLPPLFGAVPLLAAAAVFHVRELPSSIENGPAAAVHLGLGGWFWLASFAAFAPVLLLRRLDR